MAASMHIDMRTYNTFWRYGLNEVPEYSTSLVEHLHWPQSSLRVLDVIHNAT